MRELAVQAADITSVDADADAEAVLRAAAEHDRTRLLVRAPDATVLGSVHARDALVARVRGRAVTARGLARPVPRLGDDATVATRSTSCAATAPRSPSSTTTRGASPASSAWTTYWPALCSRGRSDGSTT